MTWEVPRSTAGRDEGEADFSVLAAAVVYQAPFFIGLYDAQLRPAFLNAAGRKLIGLSSTADITTYGIADFFTPQDRVVVEEVGLPTMLCTGMWEGELSLRHLRDPSRRTKVRWSVFALRNESGGRIGAAVSSNISPCEQVERALHDQHMVLASVLENLPVGIGIYNQYGDLIQSNGRMRDYIGLGRPRSSESGPSQIRGDDEADKPRILLDRCGDLSGRVTTLSS